MATKQDVTKKILRNLTKDRIKEIEEKLKNIPLFKASESVILTEEERAVMTTQVASKYFEIFEILKLDFKDDENLKDTPFRIASMFVNELIVNRYTPAPRIEAFPTTYYTLPTEEAVNKNNIIANKEHAMASAEEINLELDKILETFYKASEDNTIISNDLLKRSEYLISELEKHEFNIYPEINPRNMVVKNVDVNSLCSHHFLSFVSTDDANSKAIVAYIPRLGSNKALLGISKLQRVVDYFGRRPQLQETLNWQIKAFLSLVLRSSNVMVAFTGIVHYCEKTRGVESHCGSTASIEYTGLFNLKEYRDMAFSLAK